MPATLQAPPFTVKFLSDIPTKMSYHTHFTFEIYYFHAGTVTYLINERIYKLRPGDLILMHGMTLHKAHIEQGDCYERTIIHFDPIYFETHIEPSYASNLLAPFRKHKNVIISLEQPIRADIEHVLNKLVSLQQDEKTTGLNYQRSHIVFLELMLLIHDQYEYSIKESRPELHSTTKEKNVQDVISYIEENYKLELTLDLLQQHIHLNKFYLSKSFKEVTGTTIFQYLLERRLYAAKLLLVSSDLSITAISYEVGFKHPAHFSRTFKHATGLTAELYRKQNTM